MPRRTLIDISEDVRALEDLLIGCGGDLSDPQVMNAVDNWLAEIEGDFEQKVDNYAALITELEARSVVRETEAKRLQKLARTEASQAKFLRHKLMVTLQQLGRERVETDRHRVSVVKNGGKAPLDVYDPESVPQYLMKVITEPDNSKIREELEAGEEVPGAILQTRGSRLSIK